MSKEIENLIKDNGKWIGLIGHIVPFVYIFNENAIPPFDEVPSYIIMAVLGISAYAFWILYKDLKDFQAKNDELTKRIDLLKRATTKKPSTKQEEELPFMSDKEWKLPDMGSE